MNKIVENQQLANIVLMTSLFFSIYWIGVCFVDVYQWAFVGAIYEILWLLGLGVMYVLPALIILLALINRFKINSKYYISLFVLAITIAVFFMVLNK